jgi:hypothetical protein
MEIVEKRGAPRTQRHVRRPSCPELAVVLGALLAGACDGGQDVARINADDARQAQLAGTAVLVDVRPVGLYLEEHIQGALSLPSDVIEEGADELPRDKRLIAYCS